MVGGESRVIILGVHTALIMLATNVMMANFVTSAVVMMAVATKEEVQVTLMIMKLMFHC